MIDFYMQVTGSGEPSSFGQKAFGLLVLIVVLALVRPSRG